MSTGGQIPLGSLTVDLSQLQARLNQAGSMFQTLANSLSRSFSGTSWQRFQNAGTEAARAIGNSFRAIQPQLDALKTSIAGATAALTGLTVAGLKVGMSYEQSMARVRAITQATEAEMRQMSAAAQKLGVETVHSARDAAEGFAILAQGGYNVQQIMKAMPSVFNLVDVAQIGTAEATRVVVNVMEAMHVKVEELPVAVNKLARAMTMGGNDMTEFADAFKYVAPLAHAAGYSLEEVAATLQVLGKNGIQASMAGTSLRGMLQALTEAPPKLKKDFQELGIHVFDATGKLRALPKVLAELQRGMEKSTREGGAIGNVMQDFGARAGVGITALLNTVAENKDAISHAVGQIQEAAANSYGDKVAEDMRRTLKNRLTMVVGTLSGFGVTLVEHIGQQTAERLNALNNWIAEKKPQIDKLISTGWDLAEGTMTRFADAVGRLWHSTDVLRASLLSAGNSASSFVSQAKALWDRMPQWAKDVLSVASGFRLLSTVIGMGGLAQSIPIVGALAAALARLVNPISWLTSGFLGLRSLMPAVIALFGAMGAPAGVLIALGGALGLVVSKSEAVRAAWTRLKDGISKSVDWIKAVIGGFVTSHQEQIDRIVDKAKQFYEAYRDQLAKIVDWLEKQFAAAMRGAGDSTGILNSALTLLIGTGGQVLRAFEALLDFLNGDGRRLGSIGIDIAKMWNNAMASVLESIASMIEGATKMLDNPSVRKILSLVNPAFETIAPSTIGAAAAAGVRGQAGGLRKQNDMLDVMKTAIDESVNQSDRQRNTSIANRRAGEQVAQGAKKVGGAIAGAAQQAWQQIGEWMEGGRVKWDQANAGQAAQANAQVAQAQQGMSEQYAPVEGGGKTGAAGNVAAQQAAVRLRLAMQSGMAGMNTAARGKSQRQQFGTQGTAQRLQQIPQVQQIAEQALAIFQNLKNLTGDAREQAAKQAEALNRAYLDLVDGFKSGQITIKQFQQKLQDAAKAAQQLAKDENNLDAAEKKRVKTEQDAEALEEQKLNAQGKLSPRQQQAQQVAFQTFQQNAQQGLQQLGDLLKQGIEAQQQGAQQADEQLNAALNSGDPKQVATALNTIKGYASAQIQQTLQNVANAYGGDPNRASFGSIERQGAGVPLNFTQLLASQPQALATIKMFQAEIAALDKLLGKLPKMASGGIVNSPTVALIGEAGPEAVIPLSGTPATNAINAGLTGANAMMPPAQQIPMSTLNNLFGNPMGLFPANGMFPINPGGFTLNPLGLNAGNLGALGSMTTALSGLLSQQADLGNTGALGLLQRWQGLQQTAEDALGWARQRSLINLGGNGPSGGRSFGFSSMNGSGNPLAAAFNPFGGGSGLFGGSGGHDFSGMELHFHGIDISQPGAAQRFATQLLPAIQNAVRYQGSDMTGRKPLNFQPNGRAPLVPAAYAR